MHRTQGMLKTIVNRSGINQVTQSQLADAAQTLEGRVIDELKNKRMTNGDKTVNRIVDYFSEELGHGCHGIVNKDNGKSATPKLAAQQKEKQKQSEKE
jgi:hypothetical protein